MRGAKYFLLVTLMNSVCACTSNKTDNGPNNGLWVIPQEVTDYALFKPGTYWIFQDSATGILDSVYVYNYRSGIDTVQGSGYFEYVFHYDMHSADGFTDEMWVNMSWAKLYGLTPVWKVKWKPGDVLGQSELMVYPFNRNRLYGAYTDPGIITIVNFYNTINLANKNYQNVVLFHNTKNITENFSPSNYYISKNIGIVRREVTDSAQIWNLIRYQIIQ